MFALRIQSAPEEGHQAWVPRGATSLQKGALRIDILLGPLYGFHFEFDNFVAVGECLTFMSARDVERIIRTLPRKGKIQRPLDSRLLSLVIVNVVERTVTLLSNIGGGRSCCYSLRRGVFLCSTHLRAMADLGLTLEADDNVLPEFFAYRFVIPPRTLCRGVKKLGAGQQVKVDLTAGTITESVWYEFERHSNAHTDDDSAICAKLDGILEQEIGSTLRRWPNTALLLSGGLDSSVLAAITRSLRHNVQSVSTSFSFSNQADEETEYAVSAAKELKTNHSVYEGSEENYLRGLIESIDRAEQPVHHLQSVMLYLLFKDCARGQHEAVLCGEGADMLFGFDLHFAFYRRRELLKLTGRTGVRGIYQFFVRLFDIKSRRSTFYAADFGTNIESSQHFLWQDGFYGDASIIKSWLGCDDDAILGPRKTLMSNYRHAGLLTQFSIQGLLCDGFTTMGVWGQLAESEGIIVHYPFTTPELVEYVLSVPWDRKVREEKHFVRLLLRNYGVPEYLITRPKLAFAFPFRYWALPGTLFQPLVDMAAEIYDADFLRSLQTEDTGRAMILWSVINYYLWQKLLIEDVNPQDLCAEVLERRKTGKKYKQNLSQHG